MINPQPKQKPLRSKKIIKWFQGQPCAVCGSFWTTGHHEPLEGHGMASKGPDDQQIPLCLKHHRLRHDIGRDSFYEKFFYEKWRDLVESYKKLCHEELKL